MPESNNTVEFNTTPDRVIAWCGGGSYRYLACTVKAPELDSTEFTTGINLALVIDTSGSMSGFPLEAAKGTAILLIEQLCRNDVLSLVTFSSEVETHLRHCSMNESGRKRAAKAVRSLCTNGMTNLAGGWFQGAKEVADAMVDHPDHVNHVVLLSDGHANRGLLDPEELAYHAGEMHERGVGTSTVGIGNGYSIDQLHALSEAGGGRMHDAEHPHEIAEVVIAELGEVRRTAVEDLKVVLEGTDPVKVDILESYPLRRGNSEVVAVLGSLAGTAERTVVWQLRLPSGEPGDEVALVARCSWKPVGSTKPQESGGIPIRFRLEKPTDNNNQERNQAISILVAEHWHARILLNSITMNRNRQYREASEYVSTQARYFSEYCRDLPGTERLVYELEQLAWRIGHGMQERSRKEVQLWSKKQHRGEMDYRSKVRGSYSTYLDLEKSDQ